MLGQSLFTRSSKSTPCPVCARTKDPDCSIRHGGDVVYCHSIQDKDVFVEESTGYRFSKKTDSGAGWGVWYKPQPKKYSSPGMEPQVMYQYPARDGSQFIRVVRQKGQEIEFYQQYFIDGQWVSPKRAIEKGWKGHLESMRKAVPIYRYQEVREAIANGQPIVFCEGEKVADALWALGQPATTSIGGGNAFSRWGDYSKDLEGLGHLLIAPDMDVKGYQYAKGVRDFYQGKGVTCIKFLHAYPDFPQWKDLPKDHGLDLADEIQEGLSIEDLLERVGASIANGIGYPMDEQPVDRSAYNEKEKKPEPTYTDAKEEFKRIAKIKSVQERKFLCYQLTRKLNLSLGFVESGVKLAISELRGHTDTSIINFLSDSDDDPTVAIVPNFLYKNNVTIVASQPGVGKTLTAYDFAFRLLTGGDFMEFPVKESKVLVIQLDEAAGDAKSRINARFEEIYDRNGMSPSEKEQYRFQALSRLRVYTKMDFSDLTIFEEAIHDFKPDVVVIDNLREICGRAGVKENEQEAGELVGDLKQIIRDYNSSLLLIHHEVKSSLVEGQNRSSGHGSIIGQCAVAFTFSKPRKNAGLDKNLRFLECVKNRLGDDAKTHEFKLVHQECSWRFDYLGEASDTSNRDTATSNDLAAQILKMTCLHLERNPSWQGDSWFSVNQIKEFCSIPATAHYVYAQLEFAMQRGLLIQTKIRAQEGGKLRLYYAVNPESLERHAESLRIDELTQSKGFQVFKKKIIDELLIKTEEDKEKKITLPLSDLLSLDEPDLVNSSNKPEAESIEPLANGQFTNSHQKHDEPQNNARPKIRTDLSKVDPDLTVATCGTVSFPRGSTVRVEGRRGNDQITGLGYTNEGFAFAQLALGGKVLLDELKLIAIPYTHTA
jgi:hypothetical protein